MDLIESEKSHCYNFQCQQGKRQLGKKGRIQMLKLEQIKKSYDGVEILKEMNLEIEDGEIVSILGPSGCGKTTLLNLILGITEADSGKIWFNWRRYYESCNGKKRIQYRVSGLRIIS